MRLWNLLRWQRLQLRCHGARRKPHKQKKYYCRKNATCTQALHLAPKWRRAKSSTTKRGLFVFVAEVGSYDARLQVFKRTQVLDDITPGIVEEQLAVLGPSDCNDPFKIVAVFKQIIDRLGNAPAGNNRDFWTR